MGDALPDVLLSGINFRADLPCFQVAHPARLGGGTEAAAHPATHLGGDTDRIAIVVAHDDGLNAVAVLHPQQIFHGAIFGLLPTLDLRGRDIKPLFQLGQQGLGLIGHGGKLRDQLLMHPVEDLFCPEPRLAQRFKLCGQLLQRQGGYTAFLFHCVLLLLPGAAHRDLVIVSALRRGKSRPSRCG